MHSSIKTIGRSGQIALGKEYAGRHALLTEVEPGVWTIKLGEFVPDSERWIHEPGVAESLDRAIEWSANNPPAETGIDDIEHKLGG